ncbi:hypothetical protein JB92DRAFT_2888417 [Gautieria morchelliformis]|nr:hypothetical protein JB92DRAFT_2888417 [Gautieria morchelliformis]
MCISLVSKTPALPRLLATTLTLWFAVACKLDQCHIHSFMPMDFLHNASHPYMQHPIDDGESLILRDPYLSRSNVVILKLSD